PRIEGLIVPSKVYGIAAAGMPIVMIGDRDGEIWRLVRQHCCGIAVAPGDADGVANALRRWSKEPQETSEMGQRARQMLDTQFTRRRALEQWGRLFEQIATSGKPI